MDLFKDTNFKAILTNTGSQFLVKLITSSTTLFVTLTISYFLGLEMFGSFTKIIVFVSFFYLLIDFGMNAIFLKDYYQRVEKLFFNLIFLRLIIALLLFFIITFITIFLPFDEISRTGFSPFEKIGIILFSLSLFAQALMLSTNTVFQKNLVYHLSILPNVFSALIIFLFLILGILYNNIFLVLASYTFSGIIFFLISYSILKQRFDLQLSLEKFSIFARQIIPSSIPLGLMLLFNLVYFRADTILLSLYKSNFDVGIYGFSYKVFEFVIAIPTFFSNSLYPLLLKKEKNHREFSTLIKKYGFFLLLLSLTFMICVFFLSPLMFYIKQDFFYSITPLKILSLSFPFFFLTSLLQWVLIIKHKIKILLMIYATSLMINIMGNILFIPEYSYNASASITVFSEGLVLLLMIPFIFSFKRNLPEKNHEE